MFFPCVLRCPWRLLQVRERSYRRWGGPEELAAEREKREARQWEGALRRTARVME